MGEFLPEMNSFSNPNAIHWLRWLFKKYDFLPGITFYFISQRNATSPRFFPLLDQMRSVRIVFIRGSKFRKLDVFFLKFLKIFIYFNVSKINRYHWFLAPIGLVNPNLRINQVLNLDDPLYNEAEMATLLDWEDFLKSTNFEGKIVTTNVTTKQYLEDKGIISSVHIVEQGYNGIEMGEIKKFETFSCVYSSPYIDAGNDKQSNHPTWGATEFLKVIVPKIIEKDSNIDIHIIGRMGPDAKNLIKDYPQVKLHGLRSFRENNLIMAKCHLGIYPRKIDNGRRVQKIYEYMGVDLPIVSFLLEDTKSVIELDIGVCVTEEEQFVEEIIEMKNNPGKLNYFLDQIAIQKGNYSWTFLAKKYDTLIYHDFII
jgi:hypothetical protein